MAAERKDIDQDKVDHILASMGFIFPRTENELDSFNRMFSGHDYELKDYKINPDKIISDAEFSNKVSSQKLSFESNKKSYFKRTVLAAEIVFQLHDEPTFGHVKFQKLMFLCENIDGINISYQYSKQAAGPYDNKLMHSIDSELKKQKWFEVKKEKSGKFTKCVFIPLENVGAHKQYYKSYFKSTHEKIQWVIDTFRKEKTDWVELIATLYACWMELKQQQQLINKRSLLSLLYNWSKEKEKYSEKKALEAINWMKENNVVPN
jgi:hypothetical protein